MTEPDPVSLPEGAVTDIETTVGKTFFAISFIERANFRIDERFARASSLFAKYLARPTCPDAARAANSARVGEIFSLISNYLIWFSFRKRFFFFDTYFSLLLWLGFWFKFSITISFGNQVFKEGVGLFDYSSAQFDFGKGKVAAFGADRPDGKRFTGDDYFQMTWAFTGSNGLVYKWWSVSVVNQETYSSQPAIQGNTDVWWGVK